MLKLLTAAEFTQLTQVLTDEPLGRLATIEKTTARFHRHLVVRIGKDRADAMAPLIIGGVDFPTALARLKHELAMGDPAPVAVADDPHPATPEGNATESSGWIRGGWCCSGGGVECDAICLGIHEPPLRSASGDAN